VIGNEFDTLDRDSAWYKALTEESNIFGTTDVREKVIAKYGDDVKAREEGEKLWDEAENKYDAVDIGSGLGQIEDEEKLAGLSIEHLEALLTHQNWKKKDEDLITKILMAKQHNLNQFNPLDDEALIDTSTFNDWIPLNQELKFDSGFEETYQKWYADNEAKEKIEKDEKNKVRKEERKEIWESIVAHPYSSNSMLGVPGLMMTLMGHDVDFLSKFGKKDESDPIDYENLMRTANGVTTPINVKTEYAPDRAMPTMTEMQDTLEKELDKTYTGTDSLDAGTQEYVNEMAKIERLEKALDALETMSAEEFNALTPNSDIMDSFYKAGTTEGSIFVHDSHLLEFLKFQKVKSLDSEQMSTLKQHGSNISEFNQLTSASVLASGQDSTASYVDSSTVNNITNQGDIYTRPTTAHAPNLPHGNGGSVVYI